MVKPLRLLTNSGGTWRIVNKTAAEMKQKSKTIKKKEALLQLFYTLFLPFTV